MLARRSFQIFNSITTLAVYRHYLQRWANIEGGPPLNDSRPSFCFARIFTKLAKLIGETDKRVYYGRPKKTVWQQAIPKCIWR